MAVDNAEAQAGRPSDTQAISAEGAFESIVSVLRFPGLPEPAVFSGCERAINAIYWTLLCCTLPFAIWEHLIARYTPIGWLHVAVPLLYLPVAKGWFPRDPTHRFITGGIALTLIGLSINALYGWETQPGIYIMVPPALIAFALYGGKAMVWVTVSQMIPVIVTCALLNPNRPITGIIIGCSTWAAVTFSGAILINRVLVSSRERAQELEFLSERLMESEERLRENDRSLRHMVSIGLEEIEDATEEIDTTAASNDTEHSAVSRIRAAATALRDSAT